MKLLVLFLSLTGLVFFGCSKTEKKAETMTAEATEEVAVVTVNELLANPEKYDAMQIALTGTVVHVCKHSGKRLHLLGADDSSQLRVEAGEIGQFDKALEGSEIIAKGVFHLAQPASAGEGMHSEGNNEGGNGAGMGNGAMMGEGEPGEMAGNWLEGISFEVVPAE